MRLFPVFCLLSILFFSCSTTNNSDSTDDDVLIENPAIEVTLSATIADNGNDFDGIDDIINYSILIQNTGDVELSQVSITNHLEDLTGAPLTLDEAPSFVNANLGSPQGSLQINEIATYNAQFTITQNEVDALGISHSVTVNANSPENTSVTDESDNGDDSDGNTENDPTIIVLAEFIDPTIIAEYHILNSAGDPSTKYIFDANGQITQIRNSNNINYQFNFDADNRLVNVTTTNELDAIIESQNIIYDSENRVLSFGNRNYEFVDSDPDYFIHTETHSIDGPYYYEDENGDTIEEYEIYYQSYISGNNPLLTLCYFSGSEQTNTNTGEFTEYGFCSEFEGNSYTNNVENDCGDTDCVNFGYDNNTNPLMGSTNLIDVYGFLRVLPFGSQPSKLNILINTNNLSLVNYSDPSQIEYTYEFNEYNLPVLGNRQYVDELGPGDVNLYSKYYYQGDVIPD